MTRLVSFLGLLAMMFLAWLLSYDKRRMNWRLIVSGVLLQFFLAVLILWSPPGRAFFDLARRAVTKIVAFSNVGAEFIFGSAFSETIFAFSVLPTIIFVGSITAVLFYLGILQFVVKIMAKIMVKIMDVSGAESLAASANVYIGMTEAPLLIKPYLDTMTRSEIMAMMTGGMATIAGGVMAAYAMMGADAGHLLAASIMSAPASLVIAKIILPEKEISVTKSVVKIDLPRRDANVLDAACRGATDGLRLALNVGAMLIAFIAIVTMLNWMLGRLPEVWGSPLTLERMLGWFCFPLAWLLGVDPKDAFSVGMLIGKKTIMNEFVAYMDLVALKAVLSERSFTIATYALCGFANFGSIAIQIGGIGELVPGRRKDFAELGFRAMLGGSLAAFMTAAIAGILI